MIDYFDELELGLCLRINALSRELRLRRLFTAVSRLGDWPAYAIIYSSHIPSMAWIMVPFAVLVAASRVVLGLHYPSDVVAGAVLGAALGLASMAAVT